MVLRTDNQTAGAGDLIGVRVDGDSATVPLVASQFTELHPDISPNGRWLAYTSNESGTNEVYVRPFPNTSDVRWQVSNGGGASPVWSHDGNELFFVVNQSFDTFDNRWEPTTTEVVTKLGWTFRF